MGACSCRVLAGGMEVCVVARCGFIVASVWLTLTHAGGDQSASGVARQSYTTTATPADSPAIPQALRERRLARVISYMAYCMRARRHAACEFRLICALGHGAFDLCK